MNESIKQREAEFKRSHSMTTKTRPLMPLVLLIFSAFLLTSRLVYWYVSDPQYFPITTIKVTASYQHVTHKELETILAQYANKSYFLLPLTKLQSELNTIQWVDNVLVTRIWPDVLKIKLVEKKPIAMWNEGLMTATGQLFNPGAGGSLDLNIPKLTGPQNQQLEVLHSYEKLSKILSEYGLQAIGLNLRDNQSWILVLANDVNIYLGKKELETRLLRFCKAYPAVFAEKIDQLAGVDLRYPRGMAVQWKQQTRL